MNTVRTATPHDGNIEHGYPRKVRGRLINLQNLARAVTISAAIFFHRNEYGIILSWPIPQDSNRRRYRKRSLAAQRWGQPWRRPVHLAAATRVYSAVASRVSATSAPRSPDIYLSRTTWPLEAELSFISRLSAWVLSKRASYSKIVAEERLNASTLRNTSRCTLVPQHQPRALVFVRRKRGNAINEAWSEAKDCKWKKRLERRKN